MCGLMISIIRLLEPILPFYEEAIGTYDAQHVLMSWNAILRQTRPCPATTKDRIVQSSHITQKQQRG